MLKRLIPLLLAGAMLVACGSAEPTKSSTLQFFAMDTYMTLTVYGEGCDEAAAAAKRKERPADCFNTQVRISAPDFRIEVIPTINGGNLFEQSDQVQSSGRGQGL